jgi:O-antigen/teichoic acid export membrane protein
MSDNFHNTKRIANNTTLLYLRMLVVMGINLYSVRLLLNALGVVDYGIYDVVAGVITVLSSVSSVLQTATLRFYSYALGQNSFERLQKIFSTSIYIYVLLSVLVFLVGETIGLWFVNTQLVMPIERMNAANWIYQFSIFSFISIILQVPFSSAVLAHEDMSIFAKMSIAESFVKLIAILLISVVPFDKLIIYGAALFLIYTLVLISYIRIGQIKYAECRYKKPTERVLFKELLSFSGWSLFGSVAGVGMSQINTILVNIFFGPLVSASRAISLQINMAISSFTGSFLMAIRTPMIKSYAEGSYSYLNKLFNISNKLIYYCLLMVCIPLMFEMKNILFFWLKTTDPNTLLFSRLILVYAVIMSLNNPISIIIQATGHIRQYHIPVEIFTLLCVPATYFLFKFGYPAYTTYIAMIIASIAAHIVRLICLKKFYKPFSFLEYSKSFLLPAFVITLFSSFLVFYVHESITETFLRVAAVGFISFLVVSIFVMLIGLSKSEKDIIKQLIASIKRK